MRSYNANGSLITVALCDECQAKIAEAGILRCKVCGATASELFTNKKTFCPSCYEHLRDEISKYLISIHGSDVHIGKRPLKGSTASQKIEAVNELEDELRAAIADERYEEAAKIRDRIISIKKEK